MVILLPYLLFIFGLVIGSFLNVIIFRVFINTDTKISSDWINSRSLCPSCCHQLAWYDLIPLFSFLLLKGRCRYCHKKISWQYPLVELTTGVLFYICGNSFLVLFNKHFFAAWQLGLWLVYSLIMISILIVIGVVDLKRLIIPFKLLFPLIGLALISEPLLAWWQMRHQMIDLRQIVFDLYWLIKTVLPSFFSTTLSLSDIHIGILPSYISPFIAAIVAGGFFFLIHWFTKGKGMGFGDVPLAFLVGLVIGWENVFLAIYLAFFFGFIVSLILVLKRKKIRNQKIPFGPFIIAGFFATWFGIGTIRIVEKWFFSLIGIR